MTCAGVTVYNPLSRYINKPAMKVGGICREGACSAHLHTMFSGLILELDFAFWILDWTLIWMKVAFMVPADVSAYCYDGLPVILSNNVLSNISGTEVLYYAVDCTVVSCLL